MKTEQRQWSEALGWLPVAPPGVLGLQAQLVLLFGDRAAVTGGRCFVAVRAAYPHAHVVGCTTAGSILGAQVLDDVVCVTALAFERTRVAPALSPIRHVDQSYAAGHRLGRLLDAAGLRHIVVFAEGMLVDGSELVRGLNATIAGDVTLSGGFAADGTSMQRTYVWCDGIPQSRAVVGLGFYGEHLKVGLASRAGWHPFGPERLVTKSRGNVVYELDSRPALDLYKQYLGEQTEQLPASGLLFPLGLRIGTGEGRVLRGLLAVDEQQQSITVAGGVPTGSYVRLMTSNIEHLIEGAQAAARTIVADLEPAAPEFALVVSCNGRRQVLKGRTQEEVEAVAGVLGAPAMLAGFYAYGEIAPIAPGERSELHNQTMTITCFAET